jgi:WD40 repeat protein
MPSARRGIFVSILAALCICWAALSACRPAATSAGMRIESGLLSPRGDWALVRGSPRAGAAWSAVLRSSSGREVALGLVPAGEPAQRSFAFSADGTRAVWMRERTGSGRATFEVLTLSLDRPEAAPTRIRESVDVLPQPAVSPDGRRAALLSGRILEVFDASTGATEASMELPDWRMPRSLYFAPDGHLRLYPRSRLDPPGSSVHDLLELDPASGELVATGRVPLDSPGTLYRPAAGGDVAIVLDGSRSRVSLHDAQTGEERAVLPASGELRGAGFLAGGRIAGVYRSGSGGTAVRIFDAGGREQGALDFSSKPAAVAILGEPTEGRLVIATNPVGANSARTWSILALDLPGRRVARTWPGLAPLDPLEFWTAPALSEVSRRPGVMVVDAKGKLVKLD